MRYKQHIAATSLGRFIGQLAFVALVATGCGGGNGGGDPTPTPGISLLAGSIGGRGNIDGNATAARFRWPSAVTVDRAGNVYVVDGKVIRKLSPSGLVTTVMHAIDDLNPPNTPDTPHSVAFDASGNLYVADGNATVRMISPTGVATRLAGTPNQRGTADGMGAAAQFIRLTSIAVDRAGQVYVTDSAARTVRKISPSGAVTTLAGTPYVSGNADGIGAAASFTSPNGVTVDLDGNVYVADGSYREDSLWLRTIYGNTVRKITPAGVVTTLAGTAGAPGGVDGFGTTASFGKPIAIAMGDTGNLYVADEGNHTIRKITPAGLVTTVAGMTGTRGLADGIGSAARFDYPAGLAADDAGNIYVADRGNATIRKISATSVVTTFAGQVVVNGSTDGVGAAASFGNQAAPHENDGPNVNPTGVAVDRAGNIYIADGGNHTIRKITPTGLVSTLAGTARVRGSADGVGPAASFSYPRGIAVDDTGHVYVADSTNGTIRKITPAGLVTTLAGSAGSYSIAFTVDGIGPAAHFRYPEGVAVDRAGNVYVTDGYENLIRKITPAGSATVFAGSGAALSLDGTGRQASFNYPRGIAIDSSGNLYVAEYLSHTIRMISPTGVVTTFAGTAGVRGSDSASGATNGLELPMGVAVDAAGNVYVTEQNLTTIRKITPARVITTVVGKRDSHGIALGGLPGSLAAIGGIVIDAQGWLYVTSDAALLKVQLPQ